MRIFCFTSDVQLWALRPFAWFHEEYWGCPVTVAGFTDPWFSLPDNFEFHSIGDFSDYPYNRWSDAVIKFLHERTEEIFIYTMEDFWVLRRVDTEAIEMLHRFMQDHPEIARIDLSTDRLYAAGGYEYGTLDRLDLVSNHLPVPYHMSLQVGMWRRTALLKYLVPGETPHEVEFLGTDRMNADKAVVLGTRQFPVRYLIAVQQGKLALDGGYQVPRPPVKAEDLAEIERLGYLEPARELPIYAA